MRRLIGVLGAAAILITVSALAVNRLGDRELFSPPPEAVGESFMRSVASSRYDQALPFLLQPDVTSPDALRRLEESIEGRIGDIHDVKGEPLSRTDDRARVHVELRSASTTETIELALEWEGGEWKVFGVPKRGAGS